jgi:nitroreductase
MTAVQPTREQVECLLESATYAPNHHKVEPWKFFVLTGKAREELGIVMAEALAARLEETASDKAQAMLKKEREKPLQAPIIIAVAVEQAHQPWERDIENIEAVATAVQNMLLTAEAMGLASKWRTGDAAYDPHVKAWFGLSPDDHLVAFVYLGFAAVPHLQRIPTHFASKTQWWGWEK